MYGSNNLNRYHVYLIVLLLLLPFAVFGLVMFLSCMNLKAKCACPDCYFSTLVFMEMMFSACCYYYVRVLLLSGDVELNPGPCKYCPACNASIHIRRVYCDCGYIHLKQVVLRKHQKLKSIMP